MSLYSINAKFQWYLDNMYLTDEETGELLHPELADEFEEVFAEREEKIENTLLYVKNLTAESKAISDEIKALTERKKTLENKAERIKQYVSDALNGDNFSTSKVSVSFRKSKRVELDPRFIEWAMSMGKDELLRYKDPEVDKNAIKNWLNTGGESSYARLVDNVTMMIK